MNADRNGHMPAPHQHIEISVTTWSANRFVVDYIGCPKELLAAGLVTGFMEEKILHQRAGMHTDDHGWQFRLGPISQHSASTKRALWEGALQIKLHYSVSRHAVLSLPGVSALFPDGLPTQEERDHEIRKNPGPGDRVCGSLSAEACAYAENVGRVVNRARAIGRSHRVMRWSLINGTVIAPDWAWLVRERLAGGAA